ncbi:MAG: hypothetical protein OXG04_29550, partial [Acidobacteria bacterium]|nr:hypothetical protein [Acidobacteriota bacterium]
MSGGAAGPPRRPPGREPWADHLFQRAGVGGRFQHQALPGAQMWRDPTDGRRDGRTATIHGLG